MVRIIFGIFSLHEYFFLRETPPPPLLVVRPLKETKFVCAIPNRCPPSGLYSQPNHLTFPPPLFMDHLCLITCLSILNSIAAQNVAET